MDHDNQAFQPSLIKEIEPENKVRDLEEGTKTDTSNENKSLGNDSNGLNLDKLDTSEEKAIVSPEYSEPELIVNNEGTFGHFRRLGIFLLRWNKGKYEVSNAKLLCYYFLWYLGGAAIFAGAFAIKEYFKPKEFVDKVNNLVEAAFVGIFVGILPAWGLYMLKEFSTHFPKILMVTSKFEETDFYKVLKKPEFLNDSKISYSDGFSKMDHDDEEDEVNIESGLEKSAKKQWWIIRHGPLVGVVLSISTCVILIIASIFMEIHKDDSLKRLKKELPAFIIAVLYPIKAYTSIWFCVFFLEWQRKIYESIRKFIRKTSKTSGGNIKTELEQIIPSLKIVQKVFLLLNKKIFQKTIVMDFVLFILMGVYISWKIIKDSANFAYIIPLVLIIGHIYFICKWSNDLMSEYNETIEVLNEMPIGDVENLRSELENAPPQVVSFGGFSANYSMMTAVIAFMLSIISITGMVWPETAQECFQYNDVHGHNHTLCINDKISPGLFQNGKLELWRIQVVNDIVKQ